ncbi:MAG: helix-turn-helix transcriptional regulator [Acidovorax sp.]
MDYGARENDDQGVPNLSSRRQDPSLVALGRALRDIRIEQGISQEKLALLAEVDRSYVGRVERGDNNVAFLTLAALADALGLKISTLLSRAGL